MKRLLDSAWQRLGLQVALLAGIGLAFALGTHEPTVRAEWGPDCPQESECSVMKPNLMFVVDHSSSMNTVWGGQFDPTRWEAVVSTIQSVTASGTFLGQNTRLALTRFGHDPDPLTPGTTIPGDDSGLVDGHALDVPWYDDQGWSECNGSAIDWALAIAEPPSDGVESWTKGALDHVASVIAQTKADHPEDLDQRPYLIVLVTDGVWTSADGTTDLAPANQNPAIAAASLFENQDVPTHVIVIGGEVQAEQAADQVALAGGTVTAVHADTVELLQQGLGDVVQQVVDDVVPTCSGGTPRIMVLVDASSSMLNSNGGAQYGGPGETNWDQAREVLAGDVGSMFDVEVGGVASVGAAFHLGLAVFGHNVPAPGEQKILVEYGPCTKDNFAWALDPLTSCELPGCEDPWGGPPIIWTFEDGQQNPPGFDLPTRSHMPQCSGDQLFCAGSGTYTHLGLQEIRTHQANYLADAQLPDAPYPANEQTLFVNILITDGQYTGYSTNAQVQTELEQMFADGITTHVIGFGDFVDSAMAVAQLQSMADWGSGGALDYHDADNQAELEAALAEIVGGLDFDPCCIAYDCDECPEPSEGEPCPIGFDTNAEEPDPVPNDEDDTTESSTDESTSEDSTEGTSSGDSTSGDSTSGDSTEESSGEGEGSTGTTGSDDEVAGDSTGDAGIEGADEAGDCSCTSAPPKRPWLGSLVLLVLAVSIRRRQTA
jgi:MYXO-CTERM domain-containing protein